MIKRRLFLQLLTIPALAAVWPRAAQAQYPPHDGLAYSDDAGTTDFSALHDGDLATGIEYDI